MAARSLNPGDAFRLKTVLSDHIWFVAYRGADSLVLFNFTSFRSGKDATCIVEPQDYPSLTHRSVVAYGRGRLLEGPHVRTFEGHGILLLLPRIPPDLLATIQQGALDSKHTTNKIKDLIRSTLPPDGNSGTQFR